VRLVPSTEGSLTSSASIGKGPGPIKLLLASIEATLKHQPIREIEKGHVTTLIG